MSGPERGYPLSWRHFVVGFRASARRRARAMLAEVMSETLPQLKQVEAGPVIASLRRVARSN